MINWRVLPYDIFGVKMFAVESDGYIKHYCDTRADAQNYCDEYNGK